MKLIPAYVIAGHHAGLPDYGSAGGDESCLARRLSRTVEPYSGFEPDFQPPAFPTQTPIAPGLHPGLQLSLLTRILYSCVVDADSLDTERYDNPDQASLRGTQTSFAEWFARFESYMRANFNNPRNDIDRYRSELLEECLAKAGDPPGLRTLTLPTGSGKTLISLGYALKHAAIYGKERIIYVIPYTSIIEQNAAKFREVLSDSIVLEHHSNVRWEPREDKAEAEEEYPNLEKKRELAAENWDYPIIVTTNVQFFESLYANKRSRCRKLHNIANSVIVFDEAQMMNGDFFKPSVYALEELARNYRSTILLCTATQPELARLFPKPPQIADLVDNVPLRFDQFKRVNLQQLGKLSLEQLTPRLLEQDQVLCIVNTRKAARDLYESCKADGDAGAVFHLSARMCPRHRLAKLKQIRTRLADGLPCRLISTQLVECGVDLDFPVVYRELAGLDSIAQAAGRCNRNGLRKRGITYVFEPADSTPRGWFATTAAVARGILAGYPDDPLSLTAVRDYFSELYEYQTAGETDRTDKKAILKRLNEQANLLHFPFRSIAEDFQLIDTAAQAVLIPYDDTAVDKLRSLRYAAETKRLFRELQPYVVQLYPDEFKAFREAGELDEIREGVFALRNPEHWYQDDVGVVPFSSRYHSAEILILS